MNLDSPNFFPLKLKEDECPFQIFFSRYTNVAKNDSFIIVIPVAKDSRMEKFIENPEKFEIFLNDKIVTIVLKFYNVAHDLPLDSDPGAIIFRIYFIVYKTGFVFHCDIKTNSAKTIGKELATKELDSVQCIGVIDLHEVQFIYRFNVFLDNEDRVQYNYARDAVPQEDYKLRKIIKNSVSIASFL